MEQYEGFKGDKWKNEIDVKQFILDNYTEYTGDDSFLASPTEKTKRLNDKYQEMSKIEIVDGSRDYRMMTRNMVDSILKLKEVNRFSKGIFSWVGFKTKWLEYENIQRANGETSWSFWNLFLYSIEGIVGFTTVPLAISTIIGIIFSIVAFILMLIILIKTILFGDHVAGWPSLVCIVLFLGGIQLFSIGILGEYLSKTYIETKNRPIYIEKESNIKK